MPYPLRPLKYESGANRDSLLSWSHWTRDKGSTTDAASTPTSQSKGVAEVYGNPLIELENISYSVPGCRILSKVNFKIRCGQVCVILGPSGAGKSTLLKIINGLIEPQTGHITIAENKVDANHITRKEIRYLRRNVALISQHYPLFQNKTVVENITECLRIVHHRSRGEARQIAIESLERMHLADRINDYPKHLSGGEAQRVNIARAISIRPKLILLDEPTSALDQELVREVQESIIDLSSSNITMLIVTHDLDFAKCVADHALLLRNGRITLDGRASQVLESIQ